MVFTRLWVVGQPWLEDASSLDMLTPDFAHNADVCTHAIQDILSQASASAFKIGITCDPIWRFFECGKRYDSNGVFLDGSYVAEGYDKMVLI
jgi:hypothetical protein